MKFIKTMCGNCPFRKDGRAIVLRKGRLAQIAKDLLSSDYNTFHCHKTADSKNESACAGALGFSYKHGMVAISTRLALAFGDIAPEDLERLAGEVINTTQQAKCYE